MAQDNEARRRERPLWMRVAFNLPLVIVVGAVMVSLLWGEHSYIRRLGYQQQISQLEGEIKQYTDSTELYLHKTRDIDTHPEAIEKVAREQYGMKRADEEVFVTDIK